MMKAFDGNVCHARNAIFQVYLYLRMLYRIILDSRFLCFVAVLFEEGKHLFIAH